LQITEEAEAEAEAEEEEKKRGEERNYKLG